MRNSQTKSTAAGIKLAGRKPNAQKAATQLARGSKGLVLAARSFAAKIIGFELADSAAAELAGRWRREIDAQESKVLAWFAPAKQAAFRAHAAICRQENEALAPYREARRIINAKLAAWQTSQAQRLAATDQHASGAGAEIIGATVGSATLARIDGVSFRETWRAEVIDKVAFVRAIAARDELVNLVDPNMTALGHLARAHKSALDLPGVRVWCDLSVAASHRP